MLVLVTESATCWRTFQMEPKLDKTVTIVRLEMPVASAMLKDAQFDFKFRDAFIGLMLASCRRQLEDILNGQ